LILDIIDLQGRILQTEKINVMKGSNLLSIDISDIEQGAYLVAMHNSKNKLQSKFVKIH